MGCLFSTCRSVDDTISQPLNRNMHCFLCGQWFVSPTQYNKHIPTCNKNKNI